MSFSLEKASDLTWNWWGSIRIASRLENSYIWYLWVCLVCGKLGFECESECHFTYGGKTGNQSISAVQVGSWRLLNYHVEFVRVTQERMPINGRTRPLYRMNSCFFCVYPFSISFLWLYTHLVYVYIIYCIRFWKPNLYASLYTLSICVCVCVCVYIYIYMHIYLHIFFKSKNAFPAKGKAAACLWTRGWKKKS